MCCLPTVQHCRLRSASHGYWALNCFPNLFLLAYPVTGRSPIWIASGLDALADGF